MDDNITPKKQKKFKNIYFVGILIFVLALIYFVGMGYFDFKTISYSSDEKKEEAPVVPAIPPLDRADYDFRLDRLANIPIPIPEALPTAVASDDVKVDVVNTVPATKPKVELKTEVKPSLWPVKTVYPNDGAILPFNRIVAYYGNLYSTKMGALGEYPEDEMLAKLMAEVKLWTDADPNTPAIPALHYIAVTAQGSKGESGKYRFCMPDKEIDKIIEMAKKVNGIVFLDFQVGLSDLQTEVPLFEKYLKMPQVHLAVDPEFSMKTGARPGKVVGTLDATDVNFCAEYLAKLVRDNKLTPKILIVHRYTQKMVTNYAQIKPLPEVQIVMDMDGWGDADKKINTYKQFIYKEPVQFAGFKLFYKNDILKAGSVLMTPEKVLKLTPQPVYIQYQ